MILVKRVGWPEPYMYAVYDRVHRNFSAKITTLPYRLYITAYRNVSNPLAMCQEHLITK